MKVLGSAKILGDGTDLKVGGAPEKFTAVKAGDIFICGNYQEDTKCETIFEIEDRDLSIIRKIEVEKENFDGEQVLKEKQTLYFANCPTCSHEIELCEQTRAVILLRIFRFTRSTEDCKSIGMTWHDSQEIVRKIVVAKNEKDARELASEGEKGRHVEMWKERASCEDLAVATDDLKSGVIGYQLAFY